jgi:hypothetical protein
LCINVEVSKSGVVKVTKRQFTEESIEEFKHLLFKKSWQEVLSISEVNTKFNVFVDTILYYFNIIFLLKLFYLNEPIRNRWIIEGLKISSKRM